MPRGAPAVHVYRSNRMERLAERLTALLAVPPGGPFDADVLVVQGRGMAVWLAQRLSSELRVVANTEVVFPRDLVARALRAVLGDEAVGAQASAEEPLLWAVLGTLPGLLDRPELDRVARYLAEDPGGVRLFELSYRIATRLDEYGLYRPELVRAWERGEDGGVPPEQRWQAVLFRALTERLKTPHLAALESAYRAALRAGKVPAGLPKRVVLFGISSLPPLFVRVIAGLAPHAEVHLFTFAPSPRDFSAHLRRGQMALSLLTDDVAGGGLEINPLLTANGALGAEFAAVLEQGLSDMGVRAAAEDLFQAPDAPGVLGAVQRAVYELAPDPPVTAVRPVLPDDDVSITIDSCHGAMREVEVLHDRLLGLLTAEGSTLGPRDVVVMMPDVDAYAPVIEAVFDRRREIPYRISDRSVRKESPVVDAFLRLLELAFGRAEASAVLDLVAQEPVARKFELSPGDLDQLTEWVVASGIRWGIDAEHRVRHGQPGDNQNTWRFGLDRMLLGVALPGADRTAFAGVLPFDTTEGKGAETLGKLAELTERLFTVLAGLEAPRPLAAWRATLAHALDELFSCERDVAWQHILVKEALEEIVGMALAAGFEGDVALSVVKKMLERRLDSAHPERGFLSGGVTFCAMLPMRSIPFRVVCLLGMNDGAFPRLSRPVDFDLLRVGSPRPGDRDRRKDDRYLFLEAVLAARERLLVTYTGQSIRDNGKKPPSVVVSELVDRVQRAFDPKERPASEVERLDRIAERLVVSHPLQAWSAHYFDGSDSRLYSFDAAYLRGAVHAGGERVPVPPFFDAELPPSDSAKDGAIAVSELVRFYEDPVRFLFEQRLGVSLREVETDVPDREPLEVDPLSAWQLGNAAVLEMGEGLSRERSLELSRLRGELPLGAYGELTHRRSAEPAEEIARLAREHGYDRVTRRRAVDVVLPGGMRLHGEVPEPKNGTTVRAQYSKVRPKDLLRAWVEHLVSVVALGGAVRSVLVARGQKEGAEVVQLGAVKDAARHLEALVGWYVSGSVAPLRYAPAASHAFARAVASGRSAEAALGAARSAYTKEDLARGVHLARAFGRSKPGFTDVPAAVGDFEAIARDVVLPLVLARREPER